MILMVEINWVSWLVVGDINVTNPLFTMSGDSFDFSDVSFVLRFSFNSIYQRNSTVLKGSTLGLSIADPK